MTGHVHLQYTDLGAPVLEDHTGVPLSTVGTTTKGIQEAINFAETNHRALVVDGWSDFVEVTGGLKINSTRAQHYEFRGLLLRSSAEVPALTFDAPVFIGFDWKGHIEYVGSAQEAVRFDAQTQAPGIFGTAGGGVIHKFGDIHLPHIYVPEAGPEAVVRFAAATGGAPLSNMRLKIDGIHGGLVVPYGILVMTPTPQIPLVNRSMDGNLIDFGHIAACTSVGLQVGSGPIDHQHGPVNTNHWIGSIAADNPNGGAPMTAYVGTFAEDEIYDIRSMSIDAGTCQWGVAFGSTAKGCLARMPQIQADNSVAFGGVSCKVYAPNIIGGPPVGNGVNGNQLIQ